MTKTLTDTYGRDVSVTSDGTTDTYSLAGITLEFPTGTDKAQALSAIDGMAPSDWTPPTPPKTTISTEDFLARLTSAEQNAVMAAESSSLPLRVWLARFYAASTIDVTDATVTSGMTMLVGAGILTFDRSAQILDLGRASP